MTPASGEDRQHLFLLALWTGLLALAAHSLRDYWAHGMPPIWDNLNYQKQALYVVRLWMKGDLRAAAQLLSTDQSSLYTLSLALSYVFLGLRAGAPYATSAVVAWAALAATYRLARSLGAAAGVALAGAVLMSVSPGFLFLAFFETRNDLPAAALIALSWASILRAFWGRDLRAAAVAGACAGAAILVKASVPGYICFGLAALAVYPCPGGGLPWSWRVRALLIFGAAAGMICGWNYVPNLPVTWKYYSTWARMTTWIDAQYHLTSLTDRALFYPRNLLRTHLTGVGVIGVAAAVVVACAWRWYLGRFAAWRRLAGWLHESGTLVTLLAWFLPLTFLTIRGSLSSLGDVPVLLLLAAAVVTALARGLPERPAAIGAAAVTLASVLLVPAFPRVPLPSRNYRSADFDRWSAGLHEFKNRYGIADTPMIQVWSHPIYNVSTAEWRELLDPNVPATLGRLKLLNDTGMRESLYLLYPEDGQLIAEKLERYPLLIFSDQPGTVVGGEPFHSFNRLHAEINRAIEARGRYVRLDEIKLEGGAFTVHLALRDDATTATVEAITPDGWWQWGGAVRLMTMRPAVLQVEARPIREVEQLELRSSDGPADLTVRLRRASTTPDGRWLFESDVLPPMRRGATRWRLFAEERQMVSASVADSRPLALYLPLVSFRALKTGEELR